MGVNSLGEPVGAGEDRRTHALVMGAGFAGGLAAAEPSWLQIERSLGTSVLPARNESEDVENPLLVGAGTHPGAGVPGVLSSARVLDALVPPAAEWHPDATLRRKAVTKASRP
jgi:hypothetical protein